MPDKFLTFDIVDFPANWNDLEQISCLALAKTFPQHHLIPDAPNPRKGNTRQPVYKAIVRTLIEEPEHFHELNTGVIMYADIEHVEKRKDFTRVTLKFKEKPPGNTNALGQGHADGRHTILALHDSAVLDLSKVKVPITIRRWMPTKSDKKKTVLRQKTYAMDRKTLYDSADEFAVLKCYIPETWKVAYYQNQPEVSSNPRCDVGYLIQSVSMLSPEFYWMNRDSRRFPIKYVTNLSEHYRKMLDTAVELGEIIPDIARIEYLFWSIIKDEYERTGVKLPKFKYGDKAIIMHPNPAYIIEGIEAPRSLIFPILNSFRVLLIKNQLGVSWKIPIDDKTIKPLIKQLWLQHKKKLIQWVDTNIGHPINALTLDKGNWHDLNSIANDFLAKEIQSKSKLKLVS